MFLYVQDTNLDIPEFRGKHMYLLHELLHNYPLHNYSS